MLSDTGIGGVGAWIDNNILFKILKSGDCHTGNSKYIARLMEKVGFEVIERKNISKTIYTVVGRKN